MRHQLIIALLLFVPLGTAFSAADTPPAASGPQRWITGMTVESPGVCTGIYATVPFPMDWPEQEVKLIGQDISPGATVRYATLGGGVKQMQITIPRLSPGETAKVLVTFEVTKKPLPPPQAVDTLKAPTRGMTQYLGVSPGIETTHPEIKRLAEQTVADKTTDWQKVEALYDCARAKVKYQFDAKMQSALSALRSGQGDCEELTSLFIALCRASGIPARAVWVPGHCYPEFYLEDAAGQGRWYPGQAAGTRQFGEITEPRPILQKGDSFRVSGDAKAKRYVAETFRAKNATVNPRVEFIRKAAEAKTD